MASKNYRDLIAWHKAVDLVEELYKLTRDFPKEEAYALTSQMRRAAVSIPSNIAEGEGRRSGNEFGHFLSIAHGSLRELETQIMIARRPPPSAAHSIHSPVNMEEGTPMKNDCASF